MHDPVNSPAHYASGSIECIDAIEASMSPEAFKGFLKGNVQKYVWRYEAKGGVESLQKAQWYLNRLIATIQREYASKTALYEAVKEMETMEESPKSPPNAYVTRGKLSNECPDGFCPLPGIRQGPSEPMFQPVN
jgi:hypothetical protein